MGEIENKIPKILKILKKW